MVLARATLLIPRLNPRRGGRPALPLPRRPVPADNNIVSPPLDRTDTVLVTCASIDTRVYVPPSPDWKGTWHSSSGGPTSVHPEYVYPPGSLRI
ncbi:hypothetical protein TIFTF001_004912 [Ficus carica]|uniref:Uncharacterized protein n=1 Tax=Ficus carica TaxID=3494 RepID=A0AA87ZZW1_FICCA|nr:hypothetical protein TIFTF001_004912 [Ficus carica]